MSHPEPDTQPPPEQPITTDEAAARQADRTYADATELVRVLATHAGNPEKVARVLQRWRTVTGPNADQTIEFALAITFAECIHQPTTGTPVTVHIPERN